MAIFLSDIHTSITDAFSNNTTEIELIELKKIFYRSVAIQLDSKIDEYLEHVGEDKDIFALLQ